jgi:hypothetical protein
MRDLMHRLTARLLLVLVLVGILAPVALAISAPPPHACCLRKPMHDHGSHGLEFQAVMCGHGNCCPPVTTAQWAELEGRASHSIRPLLAYLPPAAHPVLLSHLAPALYPVRAPPPFSILMAGR